MQWNYARPRDRPLERDKASCRYANVDTACDFLFIISSIALFVTVCNIFAVETCNTSILTFRVGHGHVFLIVSVLFVTVCEIFTVKMCTILTFTDGNYQMKICKFKAACGFLCWDSNVYQICRLLRDNHVCTFQDV